MTASGIYRITNQVTGKLYIGSAVKLWPRIRQHRSNLRSGVHGNRILQRSWNKHGEAAFVFERLIICHPDDLLLYEQRAMDVYRSAERAFGYNLAPTAGNSRGSKRTPEQIARLREALARRIKEHGPHNKGCKWSQEARAAASLQRKGRPSPNKGRVWSPEFCAKIGAAKKGKKQGPYKSGNVLKTHCPWGHPYTGENLYVHPKTGRRGCKTCVHSPLVIPPYLWEMGATP